MTTPPLPRPIPDQAGPRHLRRRARSGWWRRRQQRKDCFHHDVRPDGSHAASYIAVVAHVDGSRRMWVCREDRGGCGKAWFI